MRILPHLTKVLWAKCLFEDLQELQQLGHQIYKSILKAVSEHYDLTSGKFNDTSMASKNSIE